MSLIGKLKSYDILSIFTAVLSINTIVRPTPDFGDTYYVLMYLVLIVLLSKGRVNGFNTTAVVFLIALVLSIVINDIPDFFRPWQRFALYLMVIGLCSPLIQSSPLCRFRCETFVLLQYLMLIVVILSFLFYLAGINYMGTIKGRGQSGITVHSMTLGPIAGNTLIFGVYKLLVEQKWKSAITDRLFYCGLISISFILLFLSLSRITLVACMFGILVLVFLNSKFKFGKSLRIAVGITVLLAASFPLWNSYTEGVKEKTESSIEKGGVLSSREYLWLKLIADFKSSPIFGVGFSATVIKDDPLDLNNRWVNQDSGVDKTSGRFENGNSWLAMLSMTGIFGFTCFIIIFISALKKIKRGILSVKGSKPMCLIGALLAFFSVHMMAEGYIIAGGNFFCFYVWLLIGSAFATEKMRFNKIEI